MELDFNKFFEACKPSENSLLTGSPADLRYYIDFSSVRGSNIVNELRRTITNESPKPTCQLLTGHKGCGKSVELLKLKAELEQQHFHVVYIEANRHLDMTYVGIDDILVMIACEVIRSLGASEINLREALIFPILHQISSLSPQQIPGSELFIGDSKNNTSLMERIRNNSPIYYNKIQELEQRYNTILQLLNQELLEIVTETLRHHGKQGLVVIVDNLDHLDIKPMRVWRDPFIDRDGRLGQVNCHIIYTLPLALMFESDSQVLINRLGTLKVLSILPVQLRDGRDCHERMALLQQIVLVRACSDIKDEERLHLISKLFDSHETIYRLCWVSGGHLKSLLELLYRCLNLAKKLPISRNCLEAVIKDYYAPIINELKPDEFDFIIKVIQEQSAQTLKQEQSEKEKLEYKSFLKNSIRRRLIFEYFDSGGRWFFINPVLAESKRINMWNGQKMKDFFISYNGSDKKWAGWIAWILEEAGYSVVIQAWDFRPGGNFVMEMQKAATETQQTIAVLSQNYLDAEYTHPEWAAAFVRDPQGQQRTLIPIRVGECKPTGLLRTIIHVDLVGLAQEDARRAILGAFSGRAKPNQAPPFPGTSSSATQAASERTVSELVQYPGSSTEDSVTDSIVVENSGSKISAEGRLDLIQKLYELPAQQFNMLIFTINPPAGTVPPITAAQGDRACMLLNWAEGLGGCGLIGVQQVLDKLINPQ